jgi:hypothetical protein
MNKKSWLGTVAFIVVIGVALFGAVEIANAANPTANRSSCYKPGALVPKACVKGTYEYTGNYVRPRAKWTTKQYVSGWTIETFSAPVHSPTGWTSGTIRTAAGFTWKYHGITQMSKICSIYVDAIGGGLGSSKYCN